MADAAQAVEARVDEDVLLSSTKLKWVCAGTKQSSDENIPRIGMRHHVLAVCLVLLATQTPVQSQITGCEQNSDPTDCQYYCSAVNYTAHGCNLSNTWLMSNVRTMRYMFAGTTENIPDISVWDMTGEVEDVTGLFYQAINFNQDISPWDVQYITKMDYMFSYATSFNQGLIKDWIINSGASMFGIFHEATAFVNANGGCRYFDTVVQWNMFLNDNVCFQQGSPGCTYQCVNCHTACAPTSVPTSAPTSAPTIQIGCVNSVDPTDCERYCDNASFVANNCENSAQWHMGLVTNMGGMFSGATEFNEDLTYWDTQNVINMDGMFMNALSFNRDISDWATTANLRTMNGMFFNARAFNQSSLANWDLDGVTEFHQLFEGTPALAAANGGCTKFRLELDLNQSSNGLYCSQNENCSLSRYQCGASCRAQCFPQPTAAPTTSPTGAPSAAPSATPTTSPPTYRVQPVPYPIIVYDGSGNPTSIFPIIMDLCTGDSIVCSNGAIFCSDTAFPECNKTVTSAMAAAFPSVTCARFNFGSLLYDIPFDTNMPDTLCAEEDPTFPSAIDGLVISNTSYYLALTDYECFQETGDSFLHSCVQNGALQNVYCQGVQNAPMCQYDYLCPTNTNFEHGACSPRTDAPTAAPVAEPTALPSVSPTLLPTAPTTASPTKSPTKGELEESEEWITDNPDGNLVRDIPQAQ